MLSNYSSTKWGRGALIRGGGGALIRGGRLFEGALIIRVLIRGFMVVQFTSVDSAGLVIHSLIIPMLIAS